MADLAVGKHQCFVVENVMLVCQWYWGEAWKKDG